MAREPEGYITRAEHQRIIEQINRARRLEQSANFESGRRYERSLRMGQTGTLTETTYVEWPEEETP